MTPEPTIVDYIIVAGFCTLPVLFLVWGYAWWRRDLVNQEAFHYDEFCSISPNDPHRPEKKIMEAAAICEARRHGRHMSSGPIIVEWDRSRNFHGREGGKLVTRGDYEVAITAAWLDREGPKNNIRVVKR